MYGKKGVDAVVATVLIIMITVAAVAIIWAFVVPMIKNSAVSSTAETAKLSIETSGGYTTWDEVNKIARVQVKRGNDNSNLTGLGFSFVSKGISINKNKTDVPQPNQMKVYEFDLKGELNTRPEKVLVAPITTSGVGSVVSQSSAIQNYSGINPPCDYSDWSVCNSSGFRNKTKLSSSLLGCVGESLVIEGCTPLCESFTYNAWSTCNSSGSQNRTVNTSTPSVCAGGVTPVLVNNSCTYVPPCTSYSVSNGAFVLCTCSDLQNMSANLSASYILGQDIDCTATKNWNCVSGVCAGFIPLSSNSPAFTGTFDGKGNYIDGLYVYRPSSVYASLFGVLLNTQVKNLALTNLNVTGSQWTGGLAGYVQGSVINNTYVSGFAKGSRYVGGLVGTNYLSSKIVNSYSLVNVQGSSTDIGGLVGYNTNSAIINNSFAASNVTGSSPAGGLVGTIMSSATVVGSYYYSHSGNPSVCAGLVFGGSSDCTTKTDVTWFYSRLNAPMSSWDFNSVWQENANNFPTLK